MAATATATATASPPDPLPAFVYKITPTAPPSPLPDVYPLSELDGKDGFIHLSTAAQIPTTAALYFSATPSLHLLKLRLSPRLAAATRWDAPAGPGCPHLYANFGAADVVATREVRRAEGTTWAQALAPVREEGWLL
ncbi:hypothetical protein P8C59_003044 [Phyllachora maydis]|uniref:DUF952 domain-containing protein n=1 Tax=Phyllachora maydis TaxID=1825666 RepID=A0AAD9I0T3_9PEZI|nr:hypothetical protein P8C59_003044 [Phyllachora maydis]